MQNLYVRLCEPTYQGRLHYHYNSQTDADLILIKTHLRERWSYFVTISGGSALFDLDANYFLRVAEFVVPKQSWTIVPTLEVPSSVREADLQFTEIMHSHETLELPVVVTTNISQSYVQIVFGENEPHMFWVALSENSLALIAENQLKGFFITLT